MSKPCMVRRPGFTLIELMIVIAIIAILADILIPNYFRAKALSFYSGCEENVKNLGTGCEMYAVDNQGHYCQTLAQLTPNYVRVIPTCPSVSSDTYTSSFQSAGPASGQTYDAYTIICQNGKHILINVASGFPQYTSQQGLISGK